MSSHSVRKHLRLENESYDEAIRRFIPGYETMLAVAADAIVVTEPAVVLDLGAGTGALSEAILERSDAVTVELLDVDPEMLDQARERLAPFGDRARFTLASYREPLPRADAFAASLSLHHIPKLETKTSLYAGIFRALQPGGVFVNADCSMPDDDSERHRLFRYWADHMVARGIGEERAWQYFDEWAEEDTYFPLDVEVAELAKVGFRAACVWQEGPITVVVAEKPPF